MVIVAVGFRCYKASTDFVFFGRDKNDNNIEISAWRPHTEQNA